MTCLFDLHMGLVPVNLSHHQGWVAGARASVFYGCPKRLDERLDGQDPHKHWPRLTS